MLLLLQLNSLRFLRKTIVLAECYEKSEQVLSLNPHILKKHKLEIIGIKVVPDFIN